MESRKLNKKNFWDIAGEAELDGVRKSEGLLTFKISWEGSG